MEEEKQAEAIEPWHPNEAVALLKRAIGNGVNQVIHADNLKQETDFMK